MEYPNLVTFGSRLAEFKPDFQPRTGRATIALSGDQLVVLELDGDRKGDA
tara:strand:+ start:252 stop:401 length:150 start_codon:yes stop_codon:yes gene_type:complete